MAHWTNTEEPVHPAHTALSASPAWRILYSCFLQAGFSQHQKLCSCICCYAPKEIHFSQLSSKCYWTPTFVGRHKTRVPALGNPIISSSWERLGKQSTLPEKKSWKPYKKKKKELVNLFYRETTFYYQTELTARFVYQNKS